MYGKRHLTAGPSTIFAHNRLVVILPKSNPGHVRELQDLARGGVKLVVGAEAVPVGKYTREMFRRLERRPGFPPAYGDSVLANVVSQEENVKSVVAKVQLGEADAGVVYRSDVTPRRALRVSRCSRSPTTRMSWRAIRSRSSPAARTRRAARAFLALLLGPEGRRVLAKHGLTPAETMP